MNDWKVLVIDDETTESTDIGSRYQRYCHLAEQQYDLRKFQLTFAQNADQARSMLKDNSYDIVLLDVRLKGWNDDNQGTLFKEFFNLANERSTVGLVSAQWDYSSMQLVRDFLLNHSAVNLPLLFTFKDFEDDSFAAIATQIVTFIRRSKSLFRLDIPPGKPLHILHISDLHFGSADTDETVANMPDTDYLCTHILTEWPQGPHIIVVTGDIGNTGHPDDYKKAIEWFQKIANRFGLTLPSPRILLVPGNHDISIPLAGAQELVLNTSEKKISLNKPTKTSKCLNKYAMQPFNEFVSKVSATKDTWGSSPVHYWTEFGFAEYGVVFSGFNTSKILDDNSWPLRAIDADDTNSVTQRFQMPADVSNGLLHISLTHHSPVAYPGVREPVVEENKYLNSFLRSSSVSLSPRLLLHGHQHKRWGALPNGNNYMVIGAPAPGSRGAQNTPRGVNLLTLNRDNSIISDISVKSLIDLETGWTIMDLPNCAKFKIDRQ